MATHGSKSAKNGILAWRGAKQDPPKTGKHSFAARSARRGQRAPARIIKNIQKNIKIQK
jgi:hypothetical protein